METFTFRAAGEVTFGVGSIQQVGLKVKRHGGNKILLVVDQGFAKSGPLEKITDALKKEKISFVLFDAVEPEPQGETAEQCGFLAKNEGCDFVLGVGGGSAMDTAKAAAILATNGGRVRDYQGLDKVPRPGLPKGMVPTTAGTGSEVTFTAVFINTEEKKKAGINSVHLFPEMSVLDPELTLSLPPAVTAFTGMDALAHAIESYTSLSANPLSEMVSLEAIRRIGKSLRQAVATGSDLGARSEMLLGSLLAGIGLANAGVTAVHSLSYPLGGRFRVPHGVGNGLLLPAVMKYNVLSRPERFARIAGALGEKIEGLSVKEAAVQSVEAVKRLAHDIQVPERLSDLGIPESAFPWMAEEAMKVVRPLENNPRPVSLEEAIGIYQKVF
ncbi:MAG: iron-containing alcohol dehydrogenase [Deltaproteobacteria bacterium]|nr:iron-containing alcohol dehydrogenase [Deltaproteobacteria bacterium]